MFSSPPPPKFSGFVQRLVDENILSSTQMQQALHQAKTLQLNIVAYLVDDM